MESKNINKSILKEIEILKKLKSVYVTRYVHSYLRNKPSEIWIAMEYCDGGSLSDLMLSTSSVFQESSIRSICASMLLGLTDLHNGNIIHRDVKGCNVLLTSEGRAKLADFGVSATLSATAKRRTTIGTPLWMAPEVITNEAYSVEADIWSLGITCIELAQGNPPLSHMSPFRAMFYIPKRDPPRLSSPQDYSTQFSNFLKRCLIKDPSKRSNANVLLSDPFVRVQVEELKKSGGISEVLRQLVKSTQDARLAFRNGVSTPKIRETSDTSYGELDITFGSVPAFPTPRGMSAGTLVVKKNKKDESNQNSGDVSYVTFVKKKDTIRTDSNQSNIEENGTLIIGNRTMESEYEESSGTLIVGVGKTDVEESSGTLIVGEGKIKNDTEVDEGVEEVDKGGVEEENAVKKVRSPPSHQSHGGNRSAVVEEKSFLSSLFFCF